MEAVASRQDAKSARAGTGKLDRCFYRLGAAVGEDGMTQSGGSDCEQSLREFTSRGGNRRDHQIRARLPPDRLQCFPDRCRIVTEWDGPELRNEIRVPRSLGIEQETSLAAHEFLVESEPLIQKAFVRCDVSDVGILLVSVPIRHRR